jgi:hypothetical protein
MGLQTLSNSEFQTPILTAAPDPQVSTASYVVLAGSEMDVRAFLSLALTILIATQSTYWKVFGANASDFSDEVEVKAEASVAAGAADSYAVSIAPFSYYRVKIKDNAGHGTATFRGIAKR